MNRELDSESLTSQLPTMFWILDSKSLASKSSFQTVRAYLRDANLKPSSHNGIPEVAKHLDGKPFGFGLVFGADTATRE
jgi:hypothetical protein